MKTVYSPVGMSITGDKIYDSNNTSGLVNKIKGAYHKASSKIRDSWSNIRDLAWYHFHDKFLWDKPEQASSFGRKLGTGAAIMIGGVPVVLAANDKPAEVQRANEHKPNLGVGVFYDTPNKLGLEFTLVRRDFSENFGILGGLEGYWSLSSSENRTMLQDDTYNVRDMTIRGTTERVATYKVNGFGGFIYLRFGDPKKLNLGLRLSGGKESAKVDYQLVQRVVDVNTGEDVKDPYICETGVERGDAPYLGARLAGFIPLNEGKALFIVSVGAKYHFLEGVRTPCGEDQTKVTDKWTFGGGISFLF